MKVTDDIELSGSWTPIGTSSNSFQGTFDGGKHTISGLSINSSSEHQGLFGYANNATFRDLIVAGEVASGKESGGVLGYGTGTIAFENVGNEVAVTGSGDYIGGIVGELSSASTSSLRCCYNKAEVKGTGKATGGLVGRGYTSGSYTAVVSCYNTGAVSYLSNGNGLVGGLVGSHGSIKNCYAYGTVSNTSSPVAEYYTGAFIGGSMQTVSNSADESYYRAGSCIIGSSERDQVGGWGVSGDKFKSKTAEEFADADFYKTLNGERTYAGRWRTGKYTGQSSPILAWEYEPGTPKITQQPQTADYTAGDTIAALSIEAELPDEAKSEGVLSYQWYEASGMTANSKSDQELTGETGSSYMPTLSQGQAGYYYCIVTDSFKDGYTNDGKSYKTSIASDVERVVWHSGVSVASPTFTVQPQGATVQQHGTAELSAQASLDGATEGVGDLSYQWYACDDADGANPEPVEGATSATFANVDTTQAGTFYYFCRATNTFEVTLKERADSDIVAVIVEPTYIETADELRAIASNVNDGTSTYEGITLALRNDIDLGSTDWTPIGTDHNKLFKGTFDGNGHTISGLNVSTATGSTNYGGLFGCIQNGAVRDLIVEGAVTATSSAYYHYLGGIAGYASNTTFERCGNKVTVAFNGTTNYGAYVGGIVGRSNGNGIVRECWNRADLSTTTHYVGGIAGGAENANTEISRCYNTGSITNTHTGSYCYAGGILGYIYSYATAGNVTECVNSGLTKAKASSFAGAIIGKNLSCGSNCYYLEGRFVDLDGNAQARSDGSTAVNASQLAGTAALDDGSYLIDKLNTTVSDAWSDGAIIDEAHPILSWEIPDDLPYFTEQPQSGLYSLVNAAQPTPLTAHATTTGSGELSYQWYRSETELNRGGTAIAGATSTSFTPPVAATGTFYYYCTVTNTVGGEIVSMRPSNVATYAVLAADPQLPAIETQPADQTPVQNESCSLSVSARVTDGGTPLYQWYSCTDASGSNAKAILDATDATYDPDTSAYGVSYYFAEVSNNLNGGVGKPVRSAVAKVTVKASFTISSATDMKAFRDAVDGGTTYEGLTVAVEPNPADSSVDQNPDGTCTINLGSGWNPVGYVSASIGGDVSTIISDSKFFRGTFIGNGNTFKFTTNGRENYQALFANVYGGTIEGVVVEGTVSTSGAFAAGLVALATEGAVVRNCGNKVNVTASGSNVGGLVGYSGRIPWHWLSDESNVIESCYNKRDITSNSNGSYTGGIVGRAGTTLISDCYNLGEVSRPNKNATTNAMLGGIAGEGGTNGSGMARCYNAKAVSNAAGSAYVGSLAGVYVGALADCFFSSEQAAIGNAASGSTPDGATKVDSAADIDGKLDKLNSAKSETWYSGSLLPDTKEGPQDSPILSWELSQRTVEYETNGGVWADGFTPRSTYAEKVGGALPGADDISRAGYAFGGWYENATFEGSPVSAIGVDSVGDKVFRAKWLPDLAQATVTGIPETFAFDGTNHTPKASEITVTLGDSDATVVEASKYDIEPGADKMVETGDYYVTIVPAEGSDLVGEKRVDFSIAPATLDDSMFKAIADQTFKGAGVEVRPNVERTDGCTLEEGVDYVVAYADNDKVTDSAVANIVGIGNYGDMVSRTFKIVKADIADAIVSDIADQTYTGKPLAPELSVVMDGVALVKGVDYVVAYSSNTDVGTGRATIVGHGNYRGYRSATFSIVEGEAGVVDLASCSVAPIATQPFTGSALRPDIALADALGNPLALGRDFDVIYANNTSVGTATAIVVGNGDTCKGTLYVTFDIVGTTFEDAEVSVAAIADQQWTGKGVEPELEVTTEDGYDLVAGVDYLVKYYDNTDIGTARVTVVGWGAFKGSAHKTFEIVKADNPLTAKAKKATQTVTYKPSATSTIKAANAFAISGAVGDVTYAKTAGNDKVTVASNGTITVPKALAAKSYPLTVSITASGDANYEPKTIDVSFKVSVGKAANTLKVAAKSKTLSAKAASKKTFKANKVWKVTKNLSKGKLTYKKTSGDKKIAIASNGDVTVAKGLKKGKTYTVKVTVTSAQTANYKTATAKNISLKVKVS